MSQIGSLSVKLGLTTLEWDKATDKAKQQAKDLQKSFFDFQKGLQSLSSTWGALGAIVGTISFASLIHETITFTDEVADLAKAFDLTIGQVLSFQSAIQLAGGDSEMAARMMGTLFSKIDEARQGNDKTIAQFEKLGITFEDLKRMNPYDSINQVAKGFENVNNAFEKTRLVKEFFGKGGIKLSIEDINEALAQGTTKYDRYAASIEKVSKLDDELKISYKNLKIAMADIMAVFSSGGIIGIETFSGILKGVIAASTVAGVYALGTAMYALAASFTALNVASSVSPIGLIVRGLAVAAGIFAYARTTTEPEPTPVSVEEKKSDPINTVNKQVEARKAQVALASQLINIDRQRFLIQEDFLNKDLLQNQLALESLDTQKKLAAVDSNLKKELANLDDEASVALKDQLKTQAALEKITISELSASKQKLAIQESLYKKKQVELEQQNQLLNATIAITESGTESPKQAFEYSENLQLIIYNLKNQVKESIRLQEIENEGLKLSNDSLMLTTRQSDLLLQQFNLKKSLNEEEKRLKDAGVSQEQTNIQIENLRKVGQATIDLKQQTIDAQRTFEYGWTQAFNSYMDNGTNAARIAGDMFNSVTNNMNSAIDNFVNTGKFKFSSLARSIIQDLIKIDMKAQASKIFGGSGGGGLMDMVKGLFGGGSGLSANAVGLQTSVLGYGGYAEGGNPPIGVPSIVGENGPELFIPKSAGTVIPNGQMSGMMGGQTVNYNGPYIASMNSIDTQSGVQFLAKNKQTIWASYQSANRGVPVSR